MTWVLFPEVGRPVEHSYLDGQPLADAQVLGLPGDRLAKLD